MLASTGHQTERSSTPCFPHSLQTAVRSEQSGTSPEAHELPRRPTEQEMRVLHQRFGAISCSTLTCLIRGLGLLSTYVREM